MILPARSAAASRIELMEIMDCDLDWCFLWIVGGDL
jgi:hypothetical protein